ncbi:MAG: cupredoxin family copper-binding protein [Chthoniobacterales bacterium]
MIADILPALRQPEYFHVLINPLPIYGVVAGMIGLFVAICQRSRTATIAALVILFISAASAWPVYEIGEQAYDRVLTMADDDGRAWLATHQERAEHLIWCFYALAFVSAIALVVDIKKKERPSLLLSIVVFLFGTVCLGAGGYIAYAGGRVRHREFRTEPAPGATRAAATPTSQLVTTNAAAAIPVQIRLLKYSPETVEIKVGDTVEWKNDDLTPHTVTGEGDGGFDSGSVEVGASWRHTFDKAGSFPYFCTYHPEMKGTVVVK